jgi:hypothetical protein
VESVAAIAEREGVLPKTPCESILSLAARMVAPHLPTETLAASRAQTARKWFSPVPRGLI